MTNYNVLAENAYVLIPDSISGLKISWASNTTLSISSGIVRDSTNVFDIILPTATTLDAAVVGANGIDTGSLAATKCYAVHLIYDISGKLPVATLLSLSATAPVLPSRYGAFRRIGWAFTDGSSHFKLLYQSGNGKNRTYYYDDPVTILTGGTSTSYAPISMANYLPTINLMEVKIAVNFAPTAADDTVNFRTGGSSSTSGTIIYGNVAGKYATSFLPIVSSVVLGFPVIEYKVTGTVSAQIVAFIDSL